MNRSVLLLSALLLAAPAVSMADDNGTSFWDMLRMKIEQMMPQKQLDTTTAVGGIRGAPVEDNDVYWKGEEKPEAVNSDELSAFQKALALVDAGKKTEAITAFTEFGNRYPNSPLRKDADQALAQLNAK